MGAQVLEGRTGKLVTLACLVEQTTTPFGFRIKAPMDLCSKWLIILILMLIVIVFVACRNSGDGSDSEPAGNDEHVCRWIHGVDAWQHYFRYVITCTLYTCYSKSHLYTGLNHSAWCSSFFCRKFRPVSAHLPTLHKLYFRSIFLK